MGKSGRGSAGVADDSSVTPSNAATTLRIAVVALALGTVLHEIQFGASPWGAHGLVLLAVGAALHSPTPSRFVLLSAAFIVELVADLPRPFNHTYVLAVVGLVAIVGWAAGGRHRWLEPRPAAADIGALLRATLISTWLLAFFPKLNHGFLDTSRSCAVWIVEGVPYVEVPVGLESVVVFSVLAVELGVPLLLIGRRTRTLGVLVGWSFHIVAAVAGHTAFSAIAWGLYIWFLPPEVVANAFETARRWLPDLVRRTAQHRAAVPAIIGLLFALQTIVPMLAPPWDAMIRRWLPTLAFLPAAALTLLLTVWAIQRQGAWFPRWSARRPHASRALPVAAVLLLAVNSLSPFVGLKTMWSLTMYSNLETEGTRWNHLVLPSSMQVFGWQDDLITIHDANDAAQGGLGVGDSFTTAHVPRRMFDLLAATTPDAAVRLEPAGPRVNADELATRHLGLVEQRVTGMRTLQDPPRCTL